MDEPFSAVDALTRETLRDELARVHATAHKTIIFVTHSITEAVYLADEVTAITGKPGRLAASISVDLLSLADATIPQVGISSPDCARSLTARIPPELPPSPAACARRTVS